MGWSKCERMMVSANILGGVVCLYKKNNNIIFQKPGLSVLQPKTDNTGNVNNDKKRGQKRAFSKVDQVKSPHVEIYL